MEFEILKGAAPCRPIVELVAQFWDGSLPHSEWNHAAHLAVALDAVARWGRDEALSRLRDGIRAYNEARQIANSPTSGYHETLTIFFVSAVAAFIREHEGQAPETIYPRLLESWGDKNHVFAYYSRRHLFSPYTRMEWRAPDIAPLPFEVPITV